MALKYFNVIRMNEDLSYGGMGTLKLIEDDHTRLTAALAESQEKVEEQDGVIERLRESLTTVAGEAEEIYGEEISLLVGEISDIICEGSPVMWARAEVLAEVAEWEGKLKDWVDKQALAGEEGNNG